MRRTPALIIGGGPAGAATAILLARGRAPHLLIERTAATGDALCGGFLSWRSLESLAALGIDPAALNPAMLTIARLFVGGTVAEAPLPQPARGVSRHRLDSVMMAQAISQGAAVERGADARAIDGDTVRLHDGSEIAADAIFLATGKRDLRGLSRPPEAQQADPSLGLRVRLSPAPALSKLLAGTIELHLFDRGYVGLNLQEDGSGNLCLAVHRSRLNEAGGPEGLLRALAAESPALAERLAWRQPGAIDAVANVPYGWRQRVGIAGLFRLGDQAGVIPSLAGEGMGIAIASGIRAAQAFAQGGPTASVGFQHRLARDLVRPLGVAGLIRAAAEHPAAARQLVALAKKAPIMIEIAARLTRINHSPIDAPRAA
ncbi:NAD(P)/FAD-dependent oxidoreductase [Sphingomonas sp. 28-63-12]|uniref:NAD(P)/FAD-dependent oxidoreductase n=1 Tax=Sphingomonas sp. 28-63-12 TaxID=1970434 RepID=UPI000BD2AF07|nr:MAG: FAD-binding monooxygenase [Sphingomonas sp. 28-63-12]